MADKLIKDLTGTLTAATVSSTDKIAVGDEDDSGIAKKMTTAEVQILARTGLTVSRAVETSAAGVMQASATTAAELATIHTITAGTATASKAVVLNAAKHIDEVNTTKLSIGASGSAIAVTATADELNNTADSEGYLRGLEQGDTRPLASSWTSDHTFTYKEAGFNGSILSGIDITHTMPALSACSGGTRFEHAVLANSGGDDLIIIDNGADAGFNDNTTSGNRVTLQDVGAFVLLMATGAATCQWAVIGGYGYTISTV